MSKETKYEKVGKTIHSYRVVILEGKGYRTKLLGANSSLEIGDSVSAKVLYNKSKGAHETYELVVNGKKHKT